MENLLCDTPLTMIPLSDPYLEHIDAHRKLIHMQLINLVQILSQVSRIMAEEGVMIGTFLSMGLALFPECILSYHKACYLFIYFLTRSLSPLCYHSLPLISMLCMAMLISLLFHSDASRITHVMLPFYA